MRHIGSEYGPGRSDWVVTVTLPTVMTVGCGSVRGASFPRLFNYYTYLVIYRALATSYPNPRYMSYLLILYIYPSYPYLIPWSICRDVSSDSRPEPH